MPMSIEKTRGEVGSKMSKVRASASPAAERRGRGRPKLMSDAEQARSIARQARDLFYEKGYARTTMEDISARCHISKSTLYRLFPNKTDVFGAIIDDHRQSMLALPGDYDGLPIDEAIAKIFLIEIDDGSNGDRMALIRFVMVEARQFPELRALLHERGGDRSRQDLATWLKAQHAKGRISIPNANDAAKALMDLIFGAIVIKSETGHEWPARRDRIRYLRNCIRMFTQGILPR